MKSRFFIIFFILLFSPIYAESIISGFGIFYHLPYEEALKQIEADGFIISEKTEYRDTNTDRKIIKVKSFDYDDMPYKYGSFCFDRDIDGKYYFSLSEGDIDTDKIDNNLEYAAKFSVFLQECNRKYIMSTEQYDDVQLVGYKGNNGGYILLAISDKLHIIYSPKAP